MFSPNSSASLGFSSTPFAAAGGGCGWRDPSEQLADKWWYNAEENRILKNLIKMCVNSNEDDCICVNLHFYFIIRMFVGEHKSITRLYEDGMKNYSEKGKIIMFLYTIRYGTYPGIHGFPGDMSLREFCFFCGGVCACAGEYIVVAYTLDTITPWRLLKADEE